MHRTHDDSRVGLVLVGFSSAQRLAPIAGHLGWPGLVLGDPQRLLYRRLGIGRARWWQIYSPATLAVYARALRAGQRPARPTEDTRQLGGDAIMVEGMVTALWRPRSPDDRPDPTDLLAAARAAAEARRPPDELPDHGH